MTMTHFREHSHLTPLAGAVQHTIQRLGAQEAADGVAPVILDAVVAVVAANPDNGSIRHIYVGATDSEHSHTEEHYNARRDLAYSALQEVGLQVLAPRYVHWWFGAGMVLGAGVVATVWWALS